MRTEKNLIDFLVNYARIYKDRAAFVGLKKYRRKVWTYNETLDDVSRVFQFLEKKGINKGDKVMICAPNSPYWAFLFFACAAKGAIVVPLDFNSTVDFIEKTYNKIKPKIFFASVYKDLGAAVQDKVIIENLEKLISDFEPRPGLLANYQTKENDLMEIVFTSGSTGNPKGVMITHKNLVANTRSLNSYVSLPKYSRFLSIIPLSHMFEQTAGLVSSIITGSSVSYPNSIKPKDLLNALRSQKITTVICVPAFLSLLMRKIIHEAEKVGRIDFLNKALVKFKGYPRLIRKIIFHSIHRQFGSKLDVFFVGGAPLDEKSEIFWKSLGVNVIQGYGATEASPVISTNNLSLNKPNTVGKALPGQQLKISEDGEILAKGDNITPGYFEDPESTSKIFKNGWLRTGDVGEIDKDGFLKIRSRIKNMIVTNSGMKIFPEDIEKILNQSLGVSESVVLGIKKGESIQITAVLLVNEDFKQAELLEQVNNKLASHQKIQNLIIWPKKDFPRTPTRKIKRISVQEEVKIYLSGQKKNDKAGVAASNSLYQIIAEVAGVSSSSITPRMNLLSDLKIDSIKRIQIISRMEEEYSLILSEALINQNTKVSDLENIVKNNKSISLPKTKTWWQLNIIIVYLRQLLFYILIVITKLFQKIKIQKENSKFAEPVIYVANHTSHLDTATVMRSLPFNSRKKLAVAAAKDYFYKNRILSFITTFLFNTIPIDRSGDLETTFTQIGYLLNNGWSILIYPEGGRSQSGNMVELKDGIGVITQQMEVPVVPIKINGNFQILPKGKKIPKKGSTEVKIGKAIVFNYTRPFSEITEEIEKSIRNL